jgi:predicted dehydrogenase
VTQPVRIGIVGMGGFAGSHHNTVARLEERGVVRLVCACDPRSAAFAAEQQAWRFGPRAVSVFDDYRPMLEACHGDLDYVVTPTPIQLHAEMHQAITSFGLPAYVEKPPTLDFAELDRMIAADARARRSSLVGFNYIVEKSRLALKERLLSGEFGAIRGGTLSALWPRPSSYFARNAWSGRLIMNGQIVLDSCFGNAISHFVHNMLFWTGTPGLYSWAEVAAVRAELYRAHAIEGADTFFVEADLATGCTLRFALSHACAGASTSSETVICEKAILRYGAGGQVEISWKDGRMERISSGPFDGLEENHIEYCRYMRGETARPATTLGDSRPFVVLNDLAHVSSGGILPIPAHLVTHERDEKEQKDYLSVAGLSKVVDNFLCRGIWPGYAGWRRDNGEVVTPADLGRFHGTVRAMAAANEAAARAAGAQ